MPAAIAWSAGGDGTTWEDPHNWDIGRVPGILDTVSIGNAPQAIVVQANETVGTLTFTAANATITGPGSLSMGGFTFSAPNSFLQTTADVTVATTFTWNIGTMAGAGNLFLQGTSNIAGGAGTLTIANRQVTNTGTVNWQSGNLLLSGGATITNANGATFDAQSDCLLSDDPNGAGTEAFDNAGFFKKSAAGGGTATVIDCTFNNNGPPGAVKGGPPPVTVEADVGNIEFRGSGTHNGTFQAMGLGQIDFTSGTQTLQLGTVFKGSTLIKVSNIATFEVPAGNSAMNLGNLELDDAATIQGSGINFGNGEFTNWGTFLWTGGTILDLRLTNSTGAGMQLSSGRKFLDSSILWNYGYIVWTSGSIVMNTANSACQIVNYGTFNVQANSQIVDGSTPALGLFAAIFNATSPGNPRAGGLFEITNGANATINPFFDNQASATLDEGVTHGTGTMTVPNLKNEPGSIFIP